MPYGRNLVLSVDISGYSGGDDKRQERQQHDLIRLLDEAAQQSDLDRCDWLNQPKGDEVLSLVPDSSQEPVLVGRFVRELHASLRRLNQDRSETGRIRLRVAMDSGVSYPTVNGFGGPAVVNVTRLNGDAARIALMRRPEVDLVLILSDALYHDVVRGEHASISPDQFTAVDVAEKEFHGTGWVHYVDSPAPKESQPPSSASPSAPLPGAQREHDGGKPQVVTNVGTVHADNAVFGIQHRG